MNTIQLIMMMIVMLILIGNSMVLDKANAQQVDAPSFPTGSGESDSTACPTTSGTCSKTGSSSYASWNVAYDTSTGKFSGYLITSKCPPTAVKNAPSVDCSKQTFPDPTFTTTPKMIPLLFGIGYSLHGVLIYSAFEAGFTSGFVCTGGSCDGGMDLETCEARLTQTCNNHVITNTGALLDDCSGHASPYHIHKDLVCEYDETITTSHSPLIGVMLDGRGLYGMYEGTDGKPTDLDECGGHYGPVPSATLDSDTTTSAATNVYHYHTRDEFPFTIGCYGPLTSTTCESLNSAACGSSATKTQYDIMVNSVTTTIYYKKWCPCRSSNPAALVVSGGTDTGASPTASPTTKVPTNAPTTKSPTTANPTKLPTTAKPTTAPTTKSPTTATPTKLPTTAKPTTSPTTKSPTTATPTKLPTTGTPTVTPTTSAPTTPTAAPTSPTTITPTKFPASSDNSPASNLSEQQTQTIIGAAVGVPVACLSAAAIFLWMRKKRANTSTPVQDNSTNLPIARPV